MKYEIKRGDTVILEKELQGKKTKQSPAVDYIDVSFTHPYAIQFKKNDVLTFKGQDYFLDETNNFIRKVNASNYVYNMRFQSRGYRATEVALLGYNSNNKLELTTFPINADLRTLAQLAVDNLNRGSGNSYNNIIKVNFEHKTLDDNGNEVYELNFYTSEFTEVDKNLAIQSVYRPALNEHERTIKICEYDEDKQFIKINKYIIDEDNDVSNILILEPNTKYIRVSRSMRLINTFIFVAYELGNVPNTDFEYLQIDRENVMSFLSKVSSTFNEPFYIEDTKISFGVNLNHINKDYAYGRGRGFKSIDNRRQQNQKLITVLYASGGTENLPEGYGNERLTIRPIVGDKYKDYGSVEGFYNNDSIFPTTSGELGENYDYDPAETINDFASISFKTNLGFTTEGEKAHINFTSGDFNGLSFNCLVSKDDITEYTIIRIKGYGFDTYMGLELKEGDKFNITNIKQPPIVVEQAEEKLRLEAREYLNKINGMANEIDVVCDPMVEINVNLNDVITVKDDELGIQGDYVVNGFTEDLQPLKEKTLQLSFNYTQLKNINLNIAKSRTSNEQVQIDDLQQQINEINKKI